jgi:hypothetical protein
VTHILGFFLSLTIALSLGFGATWFIVKDGHGFSRIDAGAWSTWVKSGSIEADPYTKAIIARSGEIPLQAAEGLTLVSQTDSEGLVFDPSCTYEISGALPSSRLWVLTAYTFDGQLIPNDALRYSLTSDEIIRDNLGNFKINVSATVQSGNWIPIHQSRPFKLILRLYDASVGRTKPEIQAAILLSNHKRSCP